MMNGSFIQTIGLKIVICIFVLAATKNFAAQAVVTTAEDAAGACDGIKNGCWGFHTASGELNPWWQVDLQKDYPLDRIIIFNRTDSGCAPRTRNIRVLVSLSKRPDEFHEVYRHNGKTFYGIKENAPLVVNLRNKGVKARIVRLLVPGHCSFALDEVEVYGSRNPLINIALGKPADQKSVGPYSFRGTMSKFQLGSGLAMPSLSVRIKEVINRSEKLLKRLSSLGNRKKLKKLGNNLFALKSRLLNLEQTADGRKLINGEMLSKANHIFRSITFCNPLLNFDKILFIKRYDARGVFHMCDQFYGFNSVPGGGLFVLSSPFSDNPEIINLLKDTHVENGRLKGKTLTPGSFLSPELSFDGKTILFAYSQSLGKDLEWTRESCYHIFRVDSNGNNLVQLTFGPWDDFDPCFLPNGRIVFVSERCGGYLRCGRHCPTYRLYSMTESGSDIKSISRHETHEWQPSVANDGRLVYTRWDYIDRDTNISHHIWQSYPDGSDPRSLHGNYPKKRESRPWMEMSIRAIPGSHKFVATAAAHHGHAFGSLVLIDQWTEDDGAMSQLTRLTPEVPFPEAERNIKPIRNCMVYGTPWPLSEDDYLCVYGKDAKNRGIYWIDRFGDKELIYRDPEISCLSPIPLRPRTKPPEIVSPNLASEKKIKKPGELATGTVSVLNIYDSDFEWPGDVRITGLRIIEVLPKTTPPPNKPRIGIGNQTNARAILGTVPVEKDGSVCFTAPAGKEIYFQALDKAGMAIQSMRSGTHVLPGEFLSCQGCHERKMQTPQQNITIPLAFLKSPSTIMPEVDGTNPFNYVRLVQPVLNRNCVACHKKKKALDLTGTIEGPYGWTRSYTNLAAKYGFYFDVSNGSINNGIHGGYRTIPGNFGARSAKLLDYMDKKHYGVKLSKDEYHRLVLWLDSNSEFYGSYENTKAQSRGKIVRASLGVAQK